jgi:hypothetical protein
MRDAGRILHDKWDVYDTRHCVYRPARMDGATLEAGYWRAYREFYTWGSIFRGARAKRKWRSGLRHFAYASAWKKFEPMWDAIIRTKRVAHMLPVLETILNSGEERRSFVDRPVPASDHRQPSSRVVMPDAAAETQLMFAAADLFD